MPGLERTFEKQIRRLSFRIEKLQRYDDRYSHIRLMHVLLGIPLIWAGFQFGSDRAGWVVTVAVAVAFVVVLVRHGRLRDSIHRHHILHDLKLAQIARLRLDWDGIPRAYAVPVQPAHPFAIDLDIVGERSLHHLIDTTVSIEGSRKVLSWLMETEPDLARILERQGLVRELSPLVLFRDRLALNVLKGGSTTHRRMDAQRILRWLQERGTGVSARKVLFPLTLFAACNLLVLGLGLSITGMIPWFFYVLFLLYLCTLLFLQGAIGKAFRDAIDLEVTLEGLHSVFRQLEKFGYAHTPNLAGLCAPFRDRRNRPSAQLKRVSRIVSGISVRSNPIVWLLVNGVLPWDVYFVWRLEQCRKDLLVLLPGWLEVFTEIEALSSLANFAALHPDYSYPEFADKAARGTGPSQDHKECENFAGAISEMQFLVENLGHPLIPGHTRVCNSLFLDERNRIALITGSNMSGKSSFLRTLGVGLCLAYAGAPVCASRLRTGLFRVFACMRINDSLTDGFSFFYAEVKRLKMLLETLENLHGLPVFILLDEIFRGTNNHERFIGSRAYIRALDKYPAVGAVATHDLELIKLADENKAITNYHFREEVEEGRMLFDYRLRPGPCPTTNALKIMAMAGLPV